MQLKNCGIGVLLEDYLLRWRLTDLLLKNGAVVHCARGEEEMEELLEQWIWKLLWWVLLTPTEDDGA